MNRSVFSNIYKFYRDLFVNFALTIQKIFGGDFFKKIQFSFSDYTFTVKNYLNSPGSDLEEPALIVSAGQFQPFQPYNKTGTFFNLFPDSTVNKQILCVNETKNEFIAVVYDYYQIDLNVTISTSSNFEALEIKHYLQTIYPIGAVYPFPADGYTINTLIPFFDYKEYLQNWDLENDEIFYLLQTPSEQLFKTESLTGKDTVIFLEYSFTPLLIVRDISEDEKRNLLQSIQFASNSLSFTFIVPAPIYLIIGKSGEIAQKIDLNLQILKNQKILYSESYTTSTPKDLLEKLEETYPQDQYKFYDGFIISTGVNLVENTDEYLKFELVGTKITELIENGKISNSIFFIPLTDKLFSSDPNILNSAPLYVTPKIENTISKIEITVPKNHLDDADLNYLLSETNITHGYIFTQI
jgi:hypothetical protein